MTTMMQQVPGLTPATLRKRRAELEERVEAIARRKVAIGERVGLAVVAPGAVPDSEVAALRRQREELEREQREALAALSLLRQLTRRPR